ncbi:MULTISPECIES: hypothetical protein [Actibacterium]|uniref:Cytochrome C oxidase assembly protein n=1 Tax=Actibacterium naphthalenivorans TaxID=1614693 RepID=A0A840CCL7_9RHOB|nr:MULTISPECIES: hypothetical protein [Actibacterium]ALG89744.1 cytochrome C oxidase assembly protein [Actibacterium sp. EMB200-NS6]MBB4020566.1 hypothetical protein [Actibacterium naphthalenivorans]
MAAFHEEHELHKRRFGRNLGLLAVLSAFVAIVFGLTIVKVSEGGKIEAFDHAVRPSLTVPEGGE